MKKPPSMRAVGRRLGALTLDGGASPLRDIPVQTINKMVMETEDPDLLTAWLDEEKADGKRQSAMFRIYHRLSAVQRKLDREALKRVG